MTRRGRRRLVRGGMIAVALGATAIMLLPWWWPAVVARFEGVAIGGWRTSGWSTVELRDVAYERDGLRVTAASVRVPAFGMWPLAGDEAAVFAQDVVITPRPVAAVEGAAPPAVRRIVVDVLRAWPTLQRWLPPARIERIEIATGATPWRIAIANWDGARVVAEGAIPERTANVTLTLARTDAQALRLVAEAAEWHGRIDADARVVEDGLEVDATLAWREQTARIAARFGAEGVIPARGTLDAPALEIPATELGLTDYGAVRGAVQGEWHGRSFTATVAAQAEPAEQGSDLPSLAVDLRASGDAESVRVDSALVRLPGIEATLSAPVVLALPTFVPDAAAEFVLAVDLAQVPRSAAQGRIAGRVTVAARPAAVQFSLTGEAVRWRDAEIRSLDVAGRWEPGVLRLDRGEVQLADDAAAQVSAEIDLAQRSLTSATLTAKLASAALRPWLPALPEFSELAIEAHAEGPLARPAHAGTLHWSGLAGVPGGAVAGKATWEGEGSETLTFQGEASSAAGVTMPIAARLQFAADGSVTTEVTQLTWSDAQGEWWSLVQPARVRLGGGAIAVEALKLAGDGITLDLAADVHWPVAGRVTIEGQKIPAARLAAFLPDGTGGVQIDTLSLQASWEDGPVQFEGNARATYTPETATAYTVEADFRAESNQLAFGAVRVLDASGVVLQGEGRLPLELVGQADGFRTSLPRDGAIMLKLASSPNPEFWASISRLTGWQVEAPAVAAELSGTLGAPRGRVEFATATVQPPAGLAGTVQLPQVGDVKFVVVAADDGLELAEGIFTLDGNWVSLRGRAPWSLWREAQAQRTVPWRGAEFAFSADQMPMSIASEALPTVLAPEGDVSFSLRHAPGRGFTGFLVLADAGVRPLAPIGSVRDIAGRIELDGYAARLPELGALVGGRPVTITGNANIARADRPVFDLHLRSARVPLVRQRGLVLRAGVDLSVAQTEEQVAHISGTVDLGQSVFVSDLTSLLPTSGSVAAPEQRPPYFSVREPPFADWTLDVAVHGDDFLRIENPFFQGTISADFQLGGTLAEPQAIGRAWSDHGSIVFPFGRLRVDQLEVALTPQDPYVPALLATAGTRLYGYDVRLEVSGSAADPRLLFSSDPPLTSQQVFLLLTTGEMPDTAHSITSSERAQRLALFVGRNLASSLGVGNGPGDSERLVIRSGEDFSREGGETIYVQYNLDGRWSLIAEKDRFDAYNGGIKFRLVDR